MSSRVQEIDRGWGRIRGQVQEAQRKAVKIGIQEGEVREDGTDMVLIAAVNHFGTEDGRIPSRPFLTQAYDRNRDKINRQIQAEWDAVLSGTKAIDQALNGLGQMHTDHVQREITRGNFPPNADSTVSKKGSSRPLIDTGRLRQSIRHVIEGGV